MKILISIVFYFCLIYCDKLSTNDVVFDLADITIEYEYEKNIILLEAYKTAMNDRIIESKDEKRYSQLHWVSIGNPVLSKIEPKSQLFNFRPDGIDIFVELLRLENKKRFVNAIKKKYNISVTTDQILTLKPGKFECKIELYENGKSILLNGKAIDLNTFPLRVTFPYPDIDSSFERIALKNRLSKDNSYSYFEINCQVYSQGQAYRENTLILSSKQINQFNLEDAIFGPNSEVFITRNQLNQLSHELYHKLNIIEEYQIAEKEFEQNFINEFLNQAAVSINQYVPFEKALSQISSFGIEQDIKPDLIKEELSKDFVLNKRGGKDFIALNKSRYEQSLDQVSTKMAANFSTDFAFFKINGGASFAHSKADEWQNSGASYTEQLKDINNYDKNDVEWMRKGRKIVPRRLKVSKLIKSSFNKDFKFSRVRREYYDAPFSRQISFRTKRFDEITLDDLSFKEQIDYIKPKLELFDNAESLIKTLIKNGSTFESINIQSGCWTVDFDNINLKHHKLGILITRFQFKIDLNATLTGFKNPPIVLYSFKMLFKLDHVYISREEKTYSDKEWKVKFSFEAFVIEESIVNMNKTKIAEIEWLAIGF